MTVPRKSPRIQTFRAHSVSEMVPVILEWSDAGEDNFDGPLADAPDLDTCLLRTLGWLVVASSARVQVCRDLAPNEDTFRKRLIVNTRNVRRIIYLDERGEGDAKAAE